jgi:hypothetical protein
VSRRKEANRAEAIVRGVGSLIIVVVLFAVVLILPQILKGKDVRETLKIMLSMIAGLVALGIAITIVALIVRVRVSRAREKRER